MEVTLTPQQDAFIQQQIRSGHFAIADQAVQEAIALLEDRERHTVISRPFVRKSLAQLFAESPFRGLDMDFPRDKDPLRPVDL